MNVFWIRDGKMICIFSMVLFPLGLLGIFGTDNTLMAAALGSILTVYALLLTKAIPGWARKREGDKLRKQRRQSFLHN